MAEMNGALSLFIVLSYKAFGDANISANISVNISANISANIMVRCLVKRCRIWQTGFGTWRWS